MVLGTHVEGVCQWLILSREVSCECMHNRFPVIHCTCSNFSYLKKTRHSTPKQRDKPHIVMKTLALASALITVWLKCL